MRLLIINTLYPPTVIGGAELTAHEIARGLVAAGHEVHVATLKDPLTAALPAVVDGVHVHRLPLANLYWPYAESTKAAHPLPRSLWHVIDLENPLMTRRVTRLAASLKPDVVLTQNLQGFSSAVIPALAALGLPVLHVLHDSALICPRTAMYRNGKRCGGDQSRCRDCRALSLPRFRHLKALSGVIGVSDAVLQLHDAEGLFESLPRFVVHNPLRSDLPCRKVPRPAHDAPLTFGFLGRLDQAKGVEVMLAAAERLTRAGHTFQLRIGGSGEPDYLAKLQQRYPLPEVSYAGFVDPAAFLDGIDILLFPSSARESFGNVAVEAFSQAVPVIATRSGGVCELIHDGRSGFLVEPEDVSGLARAMARYCKHRSLLARQSAYVLRQATGFSPASRVAAYLDAIRSVLGEAA